jgi:hypothetical protein
MIAARLAAIVAVDVMGYSRLIGADEAMTAGRFREHYEAQDVPDMLALRCLAKAHR